MSTPTPAPSSAVVPEDQLLELLTQLKKTTPDQARAILNEQPQIGAALVQLMVKMNVVNVDILQQTLTKFSAPAGAPAQTQIHAATPPMSGTVPALPPHLAQYYQRFHQATPPPAVPGVTSLPSQGPVVQPQSQHTYAMPGPYGGTYAPTPPVQNGYAVPQHASVQGLGMTQYAGQQQPQQQQPQQQQQQAPSSSQAAAFLNALSNVQDEQKEMILRVISMTPEQVNSLPAQERAITIQLRATLGVPTE